MRFVLRRGLVPALVVMGLIIAAPAHAEGPVFLNKIKNICSRDAAPSQQRVAPLATKTTPARQSQQRQASRTSGASGQNVERQQWLARKAATKQYITRLNQAKELERQQALIKAQQIRAANQAGVAPSTTGVVPTATTAPAQPTRPVRVIIPQADNGEGGTKPIFKNYR